MKKILIITILFAAFSCMNNDDPATESLNAQREKAIAAAIGTTNPARIYVATKVILNREHNEASPLLKEVIAVSETTGKRSMVFIDLLDKRAADAGRLPCGSIAGGWELANDGCWYHGTLFTACDGPTIFVRDTNPYVAHYIGNEPKCMSEAEFDATC